VVEPSCPSRDQLAAFRGGKLSGPAREIVAAHLEDCRACQALLPSLATEADPWRTGLSETVSAREPPGRQADRQVVGGNAAPLARLGKYELLAELGRGAMGVVYEARHVDLDKPVALKELLDGSGCGPEALARFRREMKAAGRLEHANVVRTWDAGEADGRHFLVMELVEGLGLNEVLRRHGALNVADACEAIRQAALGLQHIPEHGLVHRDLKPSNLRLTLASRGREPPEGCVKVLDLGLAGFLFGDRAGLEELTTTGYILGTADYMAPEQWVDPRTADIRADLYSLGCTLYCLLAGRPPFGGQEYGTWHKKMKAHESAPVPPVRQHRPDVPAGLAAVLERLLAKDPARRYATPAETAQALEPYCAGSNLALLLDPDMTRSHPVATAPSAGTARLPSTARGETTLSRPRRFRHVWSWCRRKPGLIGLLGVAGLAAVGLTLALSGAFGPSSGFESPTMAPADAPLKLELTLSASKQDNSQRSFSLNEPNVLPLEAGDGLRIEATASRPAFFYVLNLDAAGKVWPLYPWRKYNWDNVGEETARNFLHLPPGDSSSTSKVTPGPSGIESIVVLARETPLTAAERSALRQSLRAWPKEQGVFDPLRAAVAIGADGWRFADARDGEARGAIALDQTIVLKDPVLRLRRLLQEDLRELRVASRGVCYTFQGK
jgi:serine/threonine protein kinase